MTLFLLCLRDLNLRSLFFLRLDQVVVVSRGRGQAAHLWQMPAPQKRKDLPMRNERDIE